MVRANVKSLGLLLALVTLASGATAASAAEITEVLDAADTVILEDAATGERVSVEDKFDIALTPSFGQRYENGKIKRESYESGIQHTYNEMKYKRVVNEFDIDLEVGMYHDLAFRMNLPIVISDTMSYAYDQDDKDYLVNSSNSWFSPASNRIDTQYKFFSLQDNGDFSSGTARSGLGDMSFGIAWSPINTERRFDIEEPWLDNTGRSTMTLAFDYIAPTGTAKAINNSSVGHGVHELHFSVSGSHRFKYVEPYVGLLFALPIASDPFIDYSKAYNDAINTQRRIGPGMWGRFDLGLEFIPYESLKTDYQRYVKIDLRGYFKYVAEGRDFSELMDAFGMNSDIVNGVNAKDAAASGYGWVASKWSNAGYDNWTKFATQGSNWGGKLYEDGIFDHEGYAVMGGSIGLIIQPIQYVTIKAGFAIDYEQNHYITFTKVGRDNHTAATDTTPASKEPDGLVTENDIEERSPVFSTVFDSAGSRIRKTETLNMEWFVGVKLAY